MDRHRSALGIFHRSVKDRDILDVPLAGVGDLERVLERRLHLEVDG